MAPVRAEAGPSRALAVGLGALLLVATAAAYHGVLQNDFVNYDDDLYLTDNAALEQGLSPAGIRWAFTTGHGANWFPLTWISWLLDQELHGLDPRGVHAGNLLLHAGAVLLLFAALVRMTGALGRSAAVAGIFALHPLHVESVAWAAARKDVLSGVCFAAALLAWTRYVQSRARAARPAAARAYAATALCLALGLMAKPVLVTLPFVLLLLDVWPLRRVERLGGPALRAALLDKLPLLALSAASSAVTYLVQDAGGAVTVGHYPLDVRLSNAAVALVGYLEQAFWPVGLAVFYPHPRDTLPAGTIALSAGLVLLLTLAALACWRRWPPWFTGWLWFAGMLVPMLGIVQVGQQAAADRYTYLPLIGLSLPVVWGLHRLLVRGRLGGALVGAAAVAAGIALGLATDAQVRTWRDGETLFSHALRVTRDNHVAHTNLAVNLMRRGRDDLAELNLREALRLRPRMAQAHALLGDVLLRQERTQEAMQHYRVALRLDPALHRSQAALGNALLSEGRLDEAIAHYRAAAEARPGAAGPRANLGLALFRAGRSEEALAALREARRLDPELAQAHGYLGLVRLERGERAEALADFEAALALDGSQLVFRVARAGLLLDAGREREAASDYRAVVAAAPDHVEALNNLAWLLATASDPALRDPAEAVRLAERAVALAEPAPPELLDTLARARAEAAAQAP
ncbi:MAG: tetratricopeptide repeat protein [Myxococcota bacterium]|nr:tetratricopeptide repeat protein [Myxococcota bacterium]